MSVKSNKKLNVSGMVRELDVDDNDSDWEKSDLSCMDSVDDEPLDHFIARSTELDALEEAQQCDFTANISTGSNQDTLLCPQSPQANNDHQCQSTFQTHPTPWCVGCCLLYTSPSPRDRQKSRMPSSA